jgi:two-component system chemotaxis response regulator CheY
MAKIIIVDDSRFLSEKISQFFQSNGHDVLAAGMDGQEGFQLFKKHQPDLITLDLSMPNVDGEQCLEMIMEYDKEAKVIIISAIEDEEVLLRCLSKGAKTYITKPLCFGEEKYCEFFWDSIDEALEG